MAKSSFFSSSGTSSTIESNIQTSVDAAAASATSASTSQGEAASSATDANTAKIASEAARDAAQTAQAAALASQNAAAASATNSASSALTASQQAQNAAASASTATTQAGLATTNGAAQVALATTQAGLATTNGAAQVALATTQATNSANSATASANSATASANSATAAAASQTAAAASAASAASAFDSFDDRFLGSKTSNPSVDNDGDALVTGALYFNSTANEMRVYDGANWIAATAAGNVSLILYEYNATANQTTFSGSDTNSATLSYTVDNLQVVVNGIVLDPSDFTATNGTSVVLASGAAAGDVVNIYAFKSFTTADMVSKTNGGTFAGAVNFGAGATVTGNLTADGLRLGDGDFAAFGDGLDLQIQHNGNNSFITDAGVGDMYIRGDNSLFIQKLDGSQNKAQFITGGAVNLMHNGTTRFSTTAVGIAADQMFGIGDGDTGISLGANGADIMQFYTGNSERLRITAAGGLKLSSSGGATPTYSHTNNGEGITLRYNDDSGARAADIVATGNNPAGATTAMRFFVNPNSTDAASEVMRLQNGRVGIGTSPSYKLHSTTATGSDFAGYFHNSAGSGNGTSLVARGGANNATPNFQVQDFNGNADFTVTGTGSVGIGTSSPSYPMELASSSGAGTQFGITYVPNSVTLLLRAGGGDANIGTVGSHPLLLKTGNTERMRIDTNGTIISQNVGSTSANLEINGASTNGHYNIIMNGDSGNGYKVVFKHGSSVVGKILTNSTTTFYHTSSDYRLKQGVEDMAGAIDRVKALAPKRFQFIADADTTVDGFLAHEAQTVVPEAVHGTHNQVDDEGEPVYQSIDQSKLVPLLTGALQEAIAKIETLETKVAKLEAA